MKLLIDQKAVDIIYPWVRWYLISMAKLYSEHCLSHLVLYETNDGWIEGWGLTFLM